MRFITIILLFVYTGCFSQKQISFSYDISKGDTILRVPSYDNVKNLSFECEIFFTDIDTSFDITFVSSINDSVYFSLSQRAFPITIYPNSYSNKYDVIRWDEQYGSEVAYVKIVPHASATGTLQFNMLFNDVVNDAEHAHDVFIQDQTTDPMELYMFLHEGSVNLAQAVNIDDSTFVVQSGHSIEVEDIVCFQDSLSFMQSRVIAVDADTITINDYFDRSFSLNAGCSYGTSNFAVDGSIGRKIFSVSPSNMLDGYCWDITRMMIIITDATSMDDGKFGGITGGLTRGISFRKKNHEYKTLFNARTNGDFRLTAYDLAYIDATLGPSGQYSLGVRKSFGGQDKYGVVLRLCSATDDELQMIVSDDLTGIIKGEIKLQGHEVD